jgi:hypothetical protein
VVVYVAPEVEEEPEVTEEEEQQEEEQQEQEQQDEEQEEEEQQSEEQEQQEEPTTIRLVKHDCAPAIQTLDDFALLDSVSKLTTCPAITLPENSGADGAVASEPATFDFSFTVGDGEPQALADAEFNQAQICEEDLGADVDGDQATSTCFDASFYAVTVQGGPVTIAETTVPENHRFGTVELGADDTAGLSDIDTEAGQFAVDPAGDSEVTVHVYNFSPPRVNVVVHVCPETVVSGADFATKLQNCPAVTLATDVGPASVINGGQEVFDVVVSDANAAVRAIDTATFEDEHVCESDLQVDLDGDDGTDLCLSAYAYDNVARGSVTLTESPPVAHSLLSAEVAPTSDDPAPDLQDGVVSIDTSNDGDVTVHLFNIAAAPDEGEGNGTDGGSDTGENGTSGNSSGGNAGGGSGGSDDDDDGGNTGGNNGGDDDDDDGGGNTGGNSTGGSNNTGGDTGSDDDDDDETSNSGGGGGNNTGGGNTGGGDNGGGDNGGGDGSNNGAENTDRGTGSVAITMLYCLGDSEFTAIEVLAPGQQVDPYSFGDDTCLQDGNEFQITEFSRNDLAPFDIGFDGFEQIDGLPVTEGEAPHLITDTWSGTWMPFEIARDTVTQIVVLFYEVDDFYEDDFYEDEGDDYSYEDEEDAYSDAEEAVDSGDDLPTTGVAMADGGPNGGIVLLLGMAGFLVLGGAYRLRRAGNQ